MKLKNFRVLSWFNLIKNRLVYIFILSVIFTQSGYSSKDNTEKDIYLVFRFDDYSAQSNTELELKIIDVFRKNNLAFTVGVIPFEAAGEWRNPTINGFIPLSKEKGDILKDAIKEGVIEVSLHGYSHQVHSKFYPDSEFRGLEFAKQKDRITKGKNYLEELCGTTINTFIPPWNQFDINTLKVLDELKIQNLSGNGFGTIDMALAIQLLPSSCGLTKLKEAIQTARESADKKSIIVSLFHTTDFINDSSTNGKLDIVEFSNLINWVSEQTDVKVLTIDQAISELPPTYLKKEYWVNRKITSFFLKTPPYVRGERNYTYASESYLNLLRVKAIAFYLIILILACTIGYFLIKNAKAVILKHYIIFVILKITILLSIIYYSFRHPEFGYNLIVIFTIITGIILSSFIVLFKGRRNVSTNN